MTTEFVPAGALNSGTMAGARSIFVASREGHVPEVLSMISINHFTPSPALVFQVRSIFIFYVLNPYIDKAYNSAIIYCQIQP